MSSGAQPLDIGMGIIGVAVVADDGSAGGIAAAASAAGVDGKGGYGGRYDNAYLFGAICPARGVGAALALPYADTDMMQLHLDEISSNVAKGAHAVVLRLADSSPGRSRAAQTFR
jgi:hypothetical protein